jgi:arabinose-5-phosphate isomerase
MSIPLNETLHVSDVMLPLDRFPVMDEKTMLKEALDIMGQFQLGIACVVGPENELLGVLTDGDVRRKLLKVQKPLSALFVDDALDHSIRSPVTIAPSDSLRRAVEVMGSKRIWDLPVVDAHGLLVGLLHLHPAIQALLGIRQ